MKIKGEFIMRELVGEILLVPVGQTALQFNGMITLNPVSAQIWRSLEQGAPYEEILRGILDQFDVAEDTARQDLDRFLEEMRGRDLLEELLSDGISCIIGSLHLLVGRALRQKEDRAGTQSLVGAHAGSKFYSAGQRPCRSLGA